MTGNKSNATAQPGAPCLDRVIKIEIIDNEDMPTAQQANSQPTMTGNESNATPQTRAQRFASVIKMETDDEEHIRMRNFMDRIHKTQQNELEMYSLTADGDAIAFQGNMPMPMSSEAIVKRENDPFSGNMSYNNASVSLFCHRPPHITFQTLHLIIFYSNLRTRVIASIALTGNGFGFRAR